MALGIASHGVPAAKRASSSIALPITSSVVERRFAGGMISGFSECDRVLPEDRHELRHRPVPRAAGRLHRRSAAGYPARELQGLRGARQGAAAALARLAGVP